MALGCTRQRSHKKPTPVSHLPAASLSVKSSFPALQLAKILSQTSLGSHVERRNNCSSMENSLEELLPAEPGNREVFRLLFHFWVSFIALRGDEAR